MSSDVIWFGLAVFEQIGNARCNKRVDSESVSSTPVIFAGWKQAMDGTELCAR